jgi:LmbE family N-acetylglucosaminyl deacetylase
MIGRGEPGGALAGRPSGVEAEWAASRPGGAGRASDLDALLGPGAPTDRAPRILGLFAHPDDEVFCVGGTIARCAAAGAVTGLVSLTMGEAGQIRDARAATRRTLGIVRAKELEASASALGVDHVTCLDLGDGRLSATAPEALAEAAGELIEGFDADVVVTFGPDGGFGHPDHVASCVATIEAARGMRRPPRILHAKFPLQGQLLVDTLVEWLTSQPRRFRGSPEFGNALKLFADGTSMLGVASDHVRVEWFPPGSYLIEQDEPSTELHCILAGVADVVVERDDGSMTHLDTVRVGGFVGDDGLRSGCRRNAHVIARSAVTSLVLARQRPAVSAGRGANAVDVPDPAGPPSVADGLEDCIVVNVRPVLQQKVAALSAHRSQYALEPHLLPPAVVDRLLGLERFVVAGLPER